MHSNYSNGILLINIVIININKPELRRFTV
jgi:hypothetical protein